MTNRAGPRWLGINLSPTLPPPPSALPPLTYAKQACLYIVYYNHCFLHLLGREPRLFYLCINCFKIYWEDIGMLKLFYIGKINFGQSVSIINLFITILAPRKQICTTTQVVHNCQCRFCSK